MKDIASLLDRDELYDIFKNFSTVTGLGISLCDLDGEDIMSYYKNGGACICHMLGKSNMCQKSIKYSAQKAAELGEPYIYVCGCGLVMSASAVMLDNKLIGAVLCGPAMLWDADDYALDELEEKTSRTALTDSDRKKIAANTPKYTCDEITGASRILFRLVNYMCRTQSDYLLQRQEITKQQATISTLLSENKMKIAGKEQPRNYYSPEREKKLLTSVRLGDRAAARKILNDILSDIFLYSGGKASAITAKVYELSGFLFRAASEAGASEEDLIKTARQTQQLIDTEKTFEDLCYHTTLIVENYIDAIYNSRPQMAGVHYLRAASAYMSEHFRENITLNSTAEYVDISPSYLSHLFSGRLSTTFTDYLAQIRIDAAKELLLTGNIPIYEISAAVGYTDPNYFIRTFKKHEGLSPKQYRTLSAEN